MDSCVALPRWDRKARILNMQIRYNSTIYVWNHLVCDMRTGEDRPKNVTRNAAMEPRRLRSTLSDQDLELHAPIDLS